MDWLQAANAFLDHSQSDWYGWPQAARGIHVITVMVGIARQRREKEEG
jgi:hypothetical protein